DRSENWSVRVWDMRTGKELARFSPEASSAELHVSADGQRVAMLATTTDRLRRREKGKLDPDKTAVVWDVASGKVLARVPQGSWGGTLELSPDGRLVAVSPREEASVRVYEVASGAERLAFRHESMITGLAFTPDGSVLAAASAEAPIYL